MRFAYEWRDEKGNWYRSYGNENWEFDKLGLMRLRYAVSMICRFLPPQGNFTGLPDAGRTLILA